MPDKWSQYAQPAAKDKWAQYAQPASTTPRPAGLPAGVDLPPMGELPAPPQLDPRQQAVQAHPFTGGFDYDTRNVRSNGGDTRGSKTAAMIQNTLGPAARTVLAPFVHPLDTLSGMGHTVKGMVTHPSQYDPENPLNQMLGGVVDDFTNNGPAAAIPHLVGTGLGMYLGNEAVPAAMKVGGATAKFAGGVGQDMAESMIHKTIGTKAADVRRGSNPARAYFAEKMGPSSSMSSIADKAANAKSSVVGPAIGQTYDDATKAGVTIPVQDVSDAVMPPVRNAVSAEMGAMGSGNYQPYLDYGQRFNDNLATRAGGTGSVTPNDLFEIKRQGSDLTNWSDPSQQGFKAIRQQNVGSLGGMLEDYVPEVAPLNERYGDLSSLEKRASERAANPAQNSLTYLGKKALMSGVGSAAGIATHNPYLAVAGAALPLITDSVPFRTATAAGFNAAGNAAETTGDLMYNPAVQQSAAAPYMVPPLIPPRKKK